MPTIKDMAQAYEGTGKMKNITELPKVSTKMEVLQRDLKNKTGDSFTLQYIIVDGVEYRLPDSVLKSLKSILEENPNLTFFKVKSQGQGMDTSYTTIPLS